MPGITAMRVLIAIYAKGLASHAIFRKAPAVGGGAGDGSAGAAEC